MEQRRTAKSERVTQGWLAGEGQALLRQAPPGCVASFATAADLGELAPMSRAAFGETALSARTFRHYLGVGHALVVVLRRGGRVIGHCVAELNLRQRRVYVVETCVDPAEQGRGHACWLRGRVDAVAGAWGYRSVTSHVRVDNHAALALNRRCGMTVVRRVSDYYEDGSEAFYLGKRLTTTPSAQGLPR